jgi:hypothetical protein
MIDDPARDAGQGQRAREAERLVRGKAKREQTMRILGDGREEAGRRLRGEMELDRGTGVAGLTRCVQCRLSVALVLVRLAAASPSPCATQALGRRLADTRTVFLSAPLSFR